jgi:hypothetical protein
LYLQRIVPCWHAACSSEAASAAGHLDRAIGIFSDAIAEVMIPTPPDREIRELEIQRRRWSRPEPIELMREDPHATTRRNTFGLQRTP